LWSAGPLLRFPPPQTPFKIDAVVEGFWVLSHKCEPASAMTAALPLSAANIGSNLFHQNQTVSWLMLMPRSCKSSSIFLSEIGNWTYIMTVKRMISGLVLK
jgi:hypothetical protein